MTAIKIITSASGMAFLTFGYLIYFKKKYKLINGFEADRKVGRKTERYAELVGLTEFILGIVLLAIGIALTIFL